MDHPIHDADHRICRNFQTNIDWVSEYFILCRSILCSYVLKRNITIIPGKYVYFVLLFFARDDEEFDLPEELSELRPLTHEELKLIAQRNMIKRINTLSVSPTTSKRVKSPRST